MDTTPFYELPPECFPFTLELFDAEHPLIVLWSTEVTGAGALGIPGYGGSGRTVGARMIFPNGEVQEWTP